MSHFDKFELIMNFNFKLHIRYLTNLSEFKKTRQNATILLKMRILCYDLTYFKKFNKSRHDIIE